MTNSTLANETTTQLDELDWDLYLLQLQELNELELLADERDWS